MEDLIEDLEKIKGLKKLAKVFIDNMGSFITFFEEHPEITIECESEVVIEFEGEEKESKSENKITLKEQVLVFTGFRDKTLEEKIKKLGGKVTSAISGKTTMIVKKVKGKEKPMSSKEVKAIEDGIVIMEYQDFVKKFKLM
jgi:NAD-dependent DNA ligase